MKRRGPTPLLASAAPSSESSGAIASALGRNQCGIGRFGGDARLCLPYPPKGRECLAYDLIHVVILVGSEPAHEVYAGLPGRQCLILPIKRAIFLARDRVVGIAHIAGVFVSHSRAGMNLACQVLVFADAGERFVPRVVHDRNFLMPLLGKGYVLETKRPVG